MTSEADLASGSALAHQSTGTESEAGRLQTTFPARKLFESGTSNDVCLVESALRLFLRVQRHGNNRDGAGRQGRFQGGDGIGQHASQNRRDRTNLVELEQVDQIAQCAVIAAIGNRPLKRRGGVLTEPAANRRQIEGGGKIAGLSAYPA